MSRAELPRDVPRLLTVDDVAERLSVSTKTVRRLIGRGELRSCRIGRLLRIDAADLEDFVVRGAVLPP